MKSRLTLKNIAEEFNVSIATVSKALKDSHDIGYKTRQKIKAYAKQHHYVPNHFALKLKENRTNTIGVLIPSILNLFFAKVFSGIEKVANQNGYNLITCISNDSYQKEVIATEMFMNGTVDGIIVSLAEETQQKKNYDHFNSAIDKGIELIMFDRVADEITCDKVIVNDFQGAYNATEFFIQTGCKNIIILSIISETSVGKLRLEGYKKALKDHDIPIDKNLILDIKENDDIETLLKINLGSKAIDAILCLEETSAIVALETVKQQDYKIPDEISIIAFTNGELTKHTTPKISTVSQHGVFMGELTMDFFLKRINHTKEREPSLKVIKTSLLQRETTRQLNA